MTCNVLRPRDAIHPGPGRRLQIRGRKENPGLKTLMDTDESIMLFLSLKNFGEWQQDSNGAARFKNIPIVRPPTV